MAYARGPLTELQHRATAFVFACLAACTTLPHQGPQPVNSSLDLDGSWIARRFPCGGEPQDLQLTLRQREKQLTARCATKSKCAPQGALLWQGELREKTLELDDLPLTMQVDLELPSARTASLTLLSANRMILDIDESTVTLQRGTLEAVPIDAGTRPAAGAGGAGSGGRNAGDASVPAAGRGEAGKAGAGAAGAAAGGGRGGADMPSAAGSGAGGDSGTGPAPAGASGGGGNAGNGPAGGQGAAAGSGG
ncbi:MAG TPA: hypothetical protein VJR89_23060, partial [Polyangiales bacterium]|nr:hypothetical protein [Polyangiales bacterium]